MNLSPDEIKTRFKSRGLKVTPQRAAIYKALAETTSHPTADDLYQQVARDYPMISTNTVYYTLASLKEAGLVKEVNYWHDRARFDANVTPHHHFVCLGCRAIVDIEDPSLNRLKSMARLPKGFRVLRHEVEFYGYCASCQDQHARAAATTSRIHKTHFKRRNP